MLLKGGTSMTDEKIYEQQHLTTVYHELQAAKKSLRRAIGEHNERWQTYARGIWSRF